MKVYGHPISTCTRKVLCTLAEKGQQAEFVTVDITKGEGKDPAHLARQPWGKIPVLEDDGFFLYESRAIIRYLDSKPSGTSLTPSDLRARGLMEQWISVETSYFTPGAMKMIYQLFFNKMMGKEPDMKVVAEGRKEAEAALDVLEKGLAGHQFLAGEQFSLADICFMPYIEYLIPAGVGEIITSRPNVNAWWQRISSRPSWKRATGK